MDEPLSSDEEQKSPNIPTSETLKQKIHEFDISSKENSRPDDSDMRSEASTAKTECKPAIRLILDQLLMQVFPESNFKNKKQK